MYKLETGKPSFRILSKNDEEMFWFILRSGKEQTAFPSSEQLLLLEVTTKVGGVFGDSLNLENWEAILMFAVTKAGQGYPK